MLKEDMKYPIVMMKKITLLVLIRIGLYLAPMSFKQNMAFPITLVNENYVKN
jgi:hypothetical protein